MSEKSFGTEIQGLPLFYSQDEIKANPITHPVIPKSRVAFGGELFHLQRALSQLRRFQQTLNILIPKTREGKRLI